MLCHEPLLIAEKFKQGNYYNFMLKIRYSQQRTTKTLQMCKRLTSEERYKNN